MARRIAIVGTRYGLDESLCREYIRSIFRENEDLEQVVTGGAKGVDSWAEDEARKNGIEVIVFLPKWDKFGKRAALIRNEEIAVDLQLNGGETYALWDGKSRGTKHMIDQCGKFEVAYTVIHL